MMTQQCLVVWPFIWSACVNVHVMGCLELMCVNGNRRLCVYANMRTDRSRMAEKLGWVWKCFLSFAWLRPIESHCLLRFPECDGRHRCCWDVTSVGGFLRCRHTSGWCVLLNRLCVIHLKTGRWDHSEVSCWTCDEWQRCRRTLPKCQRSNTEFHLTMMCCCSLSPSVTCSVCFSRQSWNKSYHFQCCQAEERWCTTPLPASWY